MSYIIVAQLKLLSADFLLPRSVAISERLISTTAAAAAAALVQVKASRAITLMALVTPCLTHLIGIDVVC